MNSKPGNVSSGSLLEDLVITPIHRKKNNILNRCFIILSVFFSKGHFHLENHQQLKTEASLAEEIYGIYSLDFPFYISGQQRHTFPPISLSFSPTVITVFSFPAFLAAVHGHVLWFIHDDSQGSNWELCLAEHWRYHPPYSVLFLSPPCNVDAMILLNKNMVYTQGENRVLRKRG